jgi:hypothetical protein
LAEVQEVYDEHVRKGKTLKDPNVVAEMTKAVKDEGEKFFRGANH